jgi:hypothetical protein
MKRIASLLALALIGSAAHAEEAKAEVKKDPNDVKIETKHKRNGHTEKTKVESKARHRAGGGTVSTTETTHERDHAKKKTTETVERDANGNIVRHEKKVQH